MVENTSTHSNPMFLIKKKCVLMFLIKKVLLILSQKTLQKPTLNA